MSGKSERESIKAAAAAVEESKETPQNSVVTLSNGVKLKVRPVPPFLIRQAAMKLEKPPVPKMDIGKGREEENPDDPDYAIALEEWEQNVTDVSVNVMIAAGTELVSVPEDVPGVDDDSWLELLAFLKLEVEIETPLARYLTWMRYVGLATASDITLITGRLSRGIGLSEEEVQATAESFRNRAARRADKRRPNKAS